MKIAKWIAFGLMLAAGLMTLWTFVAKLTGGPEPAREATALVTADGAEGSAVILSVVYAKPLTPSMMFFLLFLALLIVWVVLREKTKWDKK